MRQPAIYGLDIETDTSVDGVDPAVAPVVTVALSNSAFDEVFTGREDRILLELDERLRLLRPGVLATWNGAAFDLPFLADRAALHGIELGLELQPDPTLSLAHAPLPGHRGAYRARWYEHGHIDAYRLYRAEIGPGLRVPGALRAIARLVGIHTGESVGPINELSREARHALASSDARLARVLAQRRWSAAARGIDRITGPTITSAPMARHGRHFATDEYVEHDDWAVAADPHGWEERPEDGSSGAVA